ncbi:MAG: 50S ribosomal protein L22 [Bacteroidia bacterium]|nr:MAG: 50S ribosomal protein L22 [Bacteroidia bacterium]
MGLRKQIRANKIKEAKKTQYFAVLRNSPISARKMRLVADLIRGEEITKALNILSFSSKEAAGRMEKLLLSAISNWENKNEGKNLEDHYLYVKEVRVDNAGMLKRYRPAPQGRAHRIRKRSNHVTIFIDSKEKE